MSTLNDSLTKLNNCVACGNSRLREILNLGEQPLANEYLIEPSKRNYYPLGLNLCETCTHVQLSFSVNPDILFKNYLYVSSNSNTLSEYFSRLRDHIIDEFGPSGSLIDVGSNDGFFLSKFVGTNWQTIGVDPAANLASNASKYGVKTLSAFYDYPTASLLSNSFKVAVAMNVFAHTPHPAEILRGLSTNVSDEGVAFLQTSQANMFINNEFDTVYHEHISFFNVKSMKALLARCGWFLQDVSIVNIHGGSYLWKIAKIDRSSHSLSERELEEDSYGYYKLDFYDEFNEKCQKIMKEVVDYCEIARQKGYEIAIYGAAAKGNTFLNFAQLVPDYIFDDTSLKIGKFSPLGNQEVLSPAKLPNVESKLLIIVPAWNLADEITSRIRTLRNNSSEDLLLTYFPRFSVKAVKELF